MVELNKKLKIKANDIITRMLELKDILEKIYSAERRIANNKLIFFKRSNDKVILASRYILNINIQEIKDNWTSKKEDLDELEKLFKSTVSNVLKMSKILDKLSLSDKTDPWENKEVILKNNLDNLRLAIKTLKFLDVDFNIPKKEWMSLSEKYKEIIGD